LQGGRREARRERDLASLKYQIDGWKKGSNFNLQWFGDGNDAGEEKEG